MPSSTLNEGVLGSTDSGTLMDGVAVNVLRGRLALLVAMISRVSRRETHINWSGRLSFTRASLHDDIPARQPFCNKCGLRGHATPGPWELQPAASDRQGLRRRRHVFASAGDVRRASRLVRRRGVGRFGPPRRAVEATSRSPWRSGALGQSPPLTPEVSGFFHGCLARLSSLMAFGLMSRRHQAFDKYAAVASGPPLGGSSPVLRPPSCWGLRPSVSARSGSLS